MTVADTPMPGEDPGALIEEDSEGNPLPPPQAHARLRAHLADFVSACNVPCRLKTLRGLTAYEAICKAWSAEPSRFRANSLHRMSGPNI